MLQYVPIPCTATLLPRVQVFRRRYLKGLYISAHLFVLNVFNDGPSAEAYSNRTQVLTSYVGMHASRIHCKKR